MTILATHNTLKWKVYVVRFSNFGKSNEIDGPKKF